MLPLQCTVLPFSHCRGSQIQIFPSRIQGLKGTRSRILIRNKVFQPPKILLLTSEKYDPGCLSWILDPGPDPYFFPSRIPDPETKKAPDPLLCPPVNSRLLSLPLFPYYSFSVDLAHYLLRLRNVQKNVICTVYSSFFPLNSVA
jgi:hypothetical protein